MQERKFIVFEGLSGSGKTTQALLLKEFFESRGIPTLFNDEPTKKSVFGRVVRSIIEKKKISSDVINYEFPSAIEEFVNEIISREKYAPPDTLLVADDFCKTVMGVRGKLVGDVELNESERQSLYVVDRYYDLKNTIIPSLEDGVSVVQDRFDWSTYSYGSANGLLLRTVYKWHLVVLGSFYRNPDCLFFIDVDPKTAMERLEKSGKVVDRYETLEGLKKIYVQYNSTRSFVTHPDYVLENSIGKSRKMYKIVVIDGSIPESEVFMKVRNACEGFLDSTPH